METMTMFLKVGIGRNKKNVTDSFEKNKMVCLVAQFRNLQKLKKVKNMVQ